MDAQDWHRKVTSTMGGHLLAVERQPQLLIKLTEQSANHSENVKSKMQMEIIPDVLDQLRQVQWKATVVGIAGEMRSGKSFFMNVLADREANGFVTGDSVEPVTKGIWIMVVDHPHNRDKKLILLDTEGLGDTEKDDDGDNMIFTMTMLLCTHLIFNMVGVIRRGDIATLRCITDFAQRLQETAEVEIISPFFIPLLRDFSLSLGGRTPCQYFDESMKDEYKSAICTVFAERKAFVVRSPTLDGGEMDSKENLRYTPEMSRFFVDIDKCRDFVWNKSGMENDRDLDCSLLVRLIEKYTAAINDGVLPHQKDLYASVIDDENNALLDECFSELEDQWKAILPGNDFGAIASACGGILLEMDSFYIDRFHGPLETKIMAVKALKGRFKKFTMEKWVMMVTQHVRQRISDNEFSRKGGNMEFNIVLEEMKNHFLEGFGPESDEMEALDRFISACLYFYAEAHVKRCCRKFRRWVKHREETIRLFEAVIQRITEAERAQSEHQIKLSSIGILSAAMAILGITLIPVSAGASVGLAAAGIGIGVASGAGGMVNYGVKEKQVKEAMKPINSQKEKDENKWKKLLVIMKELEEFIRSHQEQLDLVYKHNELMGIAPVISMELLRMGKIIGSGLVRFLVAIDDVISISAKVVIPLVALSVLTELATIIYHARFLAKNELSNQAKILLKAKLQMEEQLAEVKGAFEKTFPGLLDSEDNFEEELEVSLESSSEVNVQCSPEQASDTSQLLAIESSKDV